MATEKQLNIFKSFLEGYRFSDIGATVSITGTRVSQICIEVSVELFTKYKREGSVAGKYRGRTKYSHPFVNNIREMRQHKEFWFNLIEPKNTNGLSSETLQLDSPLLGFDTRILTAFKVYGVRSVEDLLNLQQSKIEKFKNIGCKSIDKIKTGLANNGLMLKDSVRNYNRYPIQRKEAIEILTKAFDHGVVENKEPKIIGIGENASVQLSGNFTKAELLAYVFFINEKNK